MDILFIMELLKISFRKKLILILTLNLVMSVQVYEFQFTAASSYRGRIDSLAMTDDGHIYAVGEHNPPYELWIYKFRNNIRLWDILSPYDDYYSPTGITIDSNGFLVAGYGRIFGPGGSILNLVVLKYDQDGNLIWKYYDTTFDFTRPTRTIALSGEKYGIVGSSSNRASVSIISKASILWKVDLLNAYGSEFSGLEKISDHFIIAITGRRFWRIQWSW